MVGVDDFSKYGETAKSYDTHPRYRSVRGDAKDVGLLKDLLGDCDHLIAGAAMIGDERGGMLGHERRITSKPASCAPTARPSVVTTSGTTPKNGRPVEPGLA